MILVRAVFALIVVQTCASKTKLNTGCFFPDMLTLIYVHNPSHFASGFMCRYMLVPKLSVRKFDPKETFRAHGTTAAAASEGVSHKSDVGFEVNPRRFRKSTKQVATLGPACNTLEMIEKLFLSGADVFRLNFSHGEHSEKLKLIKMIRTIEKKYNHPIAILADLQVRHWNCKISIPALMVSTLIYI